MREKVVSWIIRFLKGIFIGSGFILPGISGGVLAAVFGLYERMINFLAAVRTDFKENFLYFLPVGLGGIFGIFIFSVALSFFLELAEVPLMWFFIGCIGGTVPQLWKQAGKFGRRKLHIFTLIASAVLAFALLVGIERAAAGVFAPSFGSWVFAGGLIGLVAIVPGLSAANLLIFFEMYEPMTAGIAALDLWVILPLAIGAIAAVLVFAKLMALLLKRAYGSMFHAIIGFVVASTVLIIPREFNYFSVGGLICAAALIAGVAVVQLLLRLERGKESSGQCTIDD